MIKNDLDKALEIANKTPSAEDVITKIYGKKEYVEPVYSKPKRKKVAVNIPSGFPAGTVLNDDQTLTLPDGRMVQKIVEAKDEQVQTA